MADWMIEYGTEDEIAKGEAKYKADRNEMRSQMAFLLQTSKMRVVANDYCLFMTRICLSNGYDLVHLKNNQRGIGYLIIRKPEMPTQSRIIFKEPVTMGDIFKNYYEVCLDPFDTGLIPSYELKQSEGALFDMAPEEDFASECVGEMLVKPWKHGINIVGGIKENDMMRLREFQKCFTDGRSVYAKTPINSLVCLEDSVKGLNPMFGLLEGYTNTGLGATRGGLGWKLCEIAQVSSPLRVGDEGDKVMGWSDVISYITDALTPQWPEDEEEDEAKARSYMVFCFIWAWYSVRTPNYGIAFIETMLSYTTTKYKGENLLVKNCDKDGDIVYEMLRCATCYGLDIHPRPPFTYYMSGMNHNITQEDYEMIEKTIKPGVSFDQAYKAMTKTYAFCNYCEMNRKFITMFVNYFNFSTARARLEVGLQNTIAINKIVSLFSLLPNVWQLFKEERSSIFLNLPKPIYYEELSQRRMHMVTDVRLALSTVSRWSGYEELLKYGENKIKMPPGTVIGYAGPLYGLLGMLHYTDQLELLKKVIRANRESIGSHDLAFALKNYDPDITVSYARAFLRSCFSPIEHVMMALNNCDEGRAYDYHKGWLEPVRGVEIDTNELDSDDE